MIEVDFATEVDSQTELAHNIVMTTTEFDKVFARPLKRCIQINMFDAETTPEEIQSGQAYPFDCRKLKALHKVEHSKYFGNRMYHIIEISPVGVRSKRFTSAYWNDSIEIVKELNNGTFIRVNNSNDPDYNFIAFIPA